jgi:hypothetical protein
LNIWKQRGDEQDDGDDNDDYSDGSMFRKQGHTRVPRGGAFSPNGPSPPGSSSKTWAAIYDGAKFSMHKNAHILHIFDQDRNYKALLGKGPGLTLIMEYDGNAATMDDEDDKSILSSMDDALDFVANNPQGSDVMLFDLNKAEGVSNIPHSLISAIADLNSAK